MYFTCAASDEHIWRQTFSGVYRSAAGGVKYIRATVRATTAAPSPVANLQVAGALPELLGSDTTDLTIPMEKHYDCCSQCPVPWEFHLYMSHVSHMRPNVTGNLTAAVCGKRPARKNERSLPCRPIDVRRCGSG
jgi:hypothetical protein